MSTRLSIGLVIPTYNRADLIGETLESALTQTEAFDAIVVVDNGSTDHTAEVVRDFGARVTYVQVPNIGVQAARNLGVQQLNTDWIALCDSDDLLMPTFVSSARSAMEFVPDLEVLSHNFENFDGQRHWPDKFSQAPKGWFEGATRSGYVLHQVPDLLGRNLVFQPIFPTGLMVRRDCYQRLGGYDVRFRGVGAEDWEFALRLIAKAKVAFNTEVQARIRRHPGNDSANGLRMLVGECRILEHALDHLPEARGFETRFLSAVGYRQALAFDAAYAAADFALAADLLRCRRWPVMGARRRLKQAVLALPAALRNRAWRSTQGAQAQAEVPQRITVVEPAWTGAAHLPGNVGFLDFVLTAYPKAEVCFVGDAEQIGFIRGELDVGKTGRLQFHEWTCASDDLPGPSDFLRALQRWRELPAVLTWGADRILLTSVTPTALKSLHMMGIADRSAGMLHGNAVELEGWRSRNPLRRALDLSASLQGFVRAGGIALVLEERIRQQLGNRLPWLRDRLEVLEHPIAAREAYGLNEAMAASTHSGKTICIGYAGMATQAKGFLEFLQMARYLRDAAPGRFEFHAIGMLHPALKNEDQSCLARPAGAPLPRNQFLETIRRMDFLFSWQQEGYYGSAASGVVYDAVNQLVPLLARKGMQLTAWEEQGLQAGLAFDDFDSMVTTLLTTDRDTLMLERARHVQALVKIRQGLSADALSARLLQICSRLEGHPR